MRKLFVGITVLLTLGMMTSVAVAGVGNEMPSGPHYNLNIHGTSNPNHVVGDSDGHTMFINEYGDVRIYMTQNDQEGFKVTDRNGVAMEDGDKGGVPNASFNIADFEPDEGDDKKGTHWLVFARALGKPGKNITIIPEATYTDPTTGDEFFCLGEITIKSHNESDSGKGKPQTHNVTGLFYVHDLTVIVDGVEKDYPDPVWIFDVDELEDYWWNVNNQGVKLLQVRFYEGEYTCPGHQAAPAKGSPTTTWAAIKGRS